MTDHVTVTKKYFEAKADEYDLVENQKYWKLSDRLLWTLLAEKVLKELPENFSLLDAGGGTGRWSYKILEAFPKSKGRLVDISPDMLRQAKIKKEKIGANRLTIQEGDIQALPLPDELFDVVISFHNVFGFVQNPQKALNELFRVLKPGGHIILVTPNKNHGIFFNIFQGRIDEAKKIHKTGKGTFCEGMPAIDMFTLDQLRTLFQNAGFGNFQVLGFPVSIYPGYQETQLHGETKENKELLTEENIERIYAIDLELAQNPELAPRGNNFFAHAIKKVKE